MRFTKMQGLGNDYLYVYGEVPDTIRTNRECAPLDAPEKRPSVISATLEASSGSAQMASPV